jgi:2-C-methyl-D-erythritol 4-phosphate cytidylyltransferase
MTDSKTVAIIVAGGSGSRLKASKPKQFIELVGKPLLAHTVGRFEKCTLVDEIILVLPRQGFEEHEELMSRWVSEIKPVRMVRGGEERQQSTVNGLSVLPNSFDGLVAVHDGARPLSSRELIGDVIEAARRFGSAVAGLPVHETLKEVGDEGVVLGTVDRRRFYRAQTPQCFRYAILRSALERAGADGFLGTDEAQLVERMGFAVRIVPGSESNIKVTTKKDLALAKFYLEAEERRCNTG